MRTVPLKSNVARLLASSALAVILAGVPAVVEFDTDLGGVAIKSGAALAKSGDDSSGSGSGGGGDSSGSGSGGDDSSGSGSGGGDSSGSGSGGGGDSSGSGSGGDDSSGSGSGGDDSSGSGSGSDDNSGPGSGSDDNSGPGSGSDDNSGPGSSSSDNSGPGSGEDDAGARAEIEGDNIEVTFADGTREEIENGIFERKDATGRTVEERPATQADRDRLAAAAAEIEATVATVNVTPTTGGQTGAPASAEQEFTLADGTRIEVSGDNIEVKYSNGWEEEIEDGRYQVKDPNGNTVVERPATDADRARLEQQIPG